MTNVYVKKGAIVFISDEQVSQDFIDYDSMIPTEYTKDDVVVYEAGGIKLYKDSNQYKLDYDIETKEEQIARLNRENGILHEDKNRILTKFEELDLQRKLLSSR